MIKQLAFALLFIFLVSRSVLSQSFPAENISLFSNWQDTTLPHDDLDTRYNSCWGYFDPVKQKEYAILGGKDGTYFIEVTNPKDPVLRAYVPGAVTGGTVREYKTYKHYAYLISDDFGSNRFQIVNLSYLPDSVYVVHDSDEIFSRAHTLFIDGDKLYCALVIKPPMVTYSMAVFSLSDPERPSLIRNLFQDYPFINGIHDMFVRNDTIFASGDTQGLYILKFQVDKFSMLGSITHYDHAGINHSSWLFV